MEAAIRRGPHASALSPEAIAHFHAEVQEKVANNQARLLVWDNIKTNPPPQLKISSIAAVPHKSKAFRFILDRSFSLCLSNGNSIPSVNETTTKTAPQGAVDQLGHSLSRLIHAFAKTSSDDKVFMTKWDVKDSFWRLDCQAGEEFNFAYVLPQEPNNKTILVIPMSLQMGWIESLAYFCSASETSRDVADKYCQAPIGSLTPHKFLSYTEGSQSSATLPLVAASTIPFRFLIEVFVDDFMSLAIATSRQQLNHVANGTMMGIHDVFPSNCKDDNDPISTKKMLKQEAQFATRKTLLGFDFDGVDKTIWLEESKRSALLLILKSWIRRGGCRHHGIPFKEFESVTAKVWHAFTAIPTGGGLLSPCNQVLAIKAHHVYLHGNKRLLTAIQDI